jgi:hypothetical protein
MVIDSADCEPDNTAGYPIPRVELHWIPLGAGQVVVRYSGRIFEAIAAAVQRRPRCDLYHSALVVSVPDGRYTIEMTPVPDGNGNERGVVGEGAVGSCWAARFRVFRYENRRWRDGVIPDLSAAVSTTTIEMDLGGARRLLELVPTVPTPVWGRDELDAGEMWNSNSVISWLLRRGGIDTTVVGPPPRGRAPGWSAGLVVAARDPSSATRQRAAS